MTTAANPICLAGGNRYEKLNKTTCYRVLVFKSLGWYPQGILSLPSGTYYADEEIVFLVVNSPRWFEFDPDSPFSEFDWADPELLRFMAAMILCERSEHPKISFYPLIRCAPIIDANNLDFSDLDTLKGIKKALIDRSKGSMFGRNGCLTALHLPGQYELISQDNYLFDRLPQIWEAISPSNYILLRGIYAIIKSDMLSKYLEFGEEGIISLYIALEASLVLILRHIKSQGSRDPTPRQAAQWLHEHFLQPFGHPEPGESEKYFESIYQARIMTLHPASRFGDIPYAPVIYCDLHFLRDSIREILAYLVFGEHTPDYIECVKRQKSERENGE